MTLGLPLGGAEVTMMFDVRHLSKPQWDLMLIILEAMRPGIVKEASDEAG